MPATYTLTYGTYVVGGTSTTRVLDGKFRYDLTHEKFEVEFELLVKEATVPAFVTELNTMRAAFRLRRQDFNLDLSGTDRYDFSHALGTGYNSQARVRKLGTDTDAQVSSRFLVTIAIELPVQNAALNGRRVASMSLVQDSNGRQVIRVVGNYTPVPGTFATARAAYDADINTYINGLISGIGGTPANWERIASTATSDDQDKNLLFDITQQQVLARQGKSAFNNAAVKNPSLQVSTISQGTESVDGKAQRPTLITANYFTEVDSTVTTDLPTLWNNEILPNILSRVRQDSGAPSLTIIGGGPTFNRDFNTISAVLTIQAFGGSGVLESSIETTDDIDLGVSVVPVWNGKVFEADIYQGPQAWFRIIRTTVTRVVSRRQSRFFTTVSDKTQKKKVAGSLSDTLLFELTREALSLVTDFVPLRKASSNRRFIVGLPGSQKLLEIEIETVVLQRVKPRQQVGVIL